MPWGEAQVARLEPLLTREWLITNGSADMPRAPWPASSPAVTTDCLIAALPAPVGRMMLLPHLSEQIRLPDGRNVRFSGEERTGGPLAVYGANYLAEFRLETGLPVWRYQVGEIVLEKRVLLPHQQNTVYVIYRLLEGPDCVRLKLLPSVQFRSHDGPVSTPLPKRLPACQRGWPPRTVGGPEFPTLRMTLFGATAGLHFGTAAPHPAPLSHGRKPRL